MAALAGGFVATVMMSLQMTMAKSAGMTAMPSMPLISGSMMSGDRSTAMRIGAVVHYLVMGAMVFGIVYAALFTAFDEASWWFGALIGLAHGLVVGLVFLPMMPAVHPRSSRQSIGVGTPDGGYAVAVDAKASRG
ncbi:MAG: hypothetical protein GEV08_11820 [Acidimicrobiia bacterium]|nr:hypothetical protein [Acidimicrobiia bacterium]